MTALEALNLAAPLADTYSAVEQRLLVAIARQLSLNDDHSLNEVSKWQIKRLARLGMLRKDAARIVAAGTKGVPADFTDTVQQAITSALAEDGLVDMWQNESFAESAKQAVRHYRRQAQSVYNQVNTVMKYKAESSFVRAVNSVADKWTQDMRRQQSEIADKQAVLDILNSNTADVVNGSAARTRAVRTTIREMAQRGIPAFVDRAGREWSPEAYVNMDIRATVKNTALEAKFSVMDSLGQDVFEVSSHPGSRPKCRPWQGKLISRSGKTTEITDLHGRKHKVIPLSQTSFGEPDGLFGINCGHRPRGCTEGVFTKSAVAYDDEADKELYNKVCRQRELERKVRKSKTEADMLEAAGDAEGAKEVRRRMAEQNRQLRAYCESNGLKYRSDRVRTYGSVKPAKVSPTPMVAPPVEKPTDIRSRCDELRKQYSDEVKAAEKLKAEYKQLEAKVYFGDGGTDEEMKRLRQMNDEVKITEARVADIKTKMLGAQKEYADAAGKRLVDDGIFEQVKLPKTITPAAVDEIESKVRELYSEYGIMPKKMLYNPLKSGGTYASYRWDEETLYLGNGAIDPEYFAEHHQKTIEAFKARQEKLIPFAEKRLAEAEKILSDKSIKGYERHKAQLMRDEALVQLNQVRNVVPDTIGEVIEHEYAHFLHDTANRLSGIYEPKKYIGMKKLHGEPDIWDSNNRSGQVAAASISKYAADNPLEAVAEAFVAKRKGYSVPKVLDDILDDIDKAVGKSLDKSAGSGIIEIERAMAAKTFDKAAEYAKKKLGMSISSISELPLETVNAVNNSIGKLYQDIPSLSGIIDEVVVDDINEIAKSALGWVNGSPRIRLKLSRSYFANMSVGEIEEAVSNLANAGVFTPKIGFYGIFQHEAVHLAEFQQTIKRYGGYEEAIKQSIDGFELAKEIKELALRNCSLDDTSITANSMLCSYAEFNAAEFLAEGYSSTNSNPLTDEIKRLLHKKWGM